MKDLILGSHVSLSGSKMLLGSVEEAISYNANTFMIYTGAPQNTNRRDISEFRKEEAFDLMSKNNILKENIVVHSPYIINLANSQKPYVFDLAVDFLIKELIRVEQLGFRYLVLHPGSHVDSGEEIGLNQIVKGLNLVLKHFEKNKIENNVIILLETMSGKGSEIGYKFEHLKYILDNVINKAKFGVCLDTCHIHDAGFDLINNLDKIIDDFDNIIGLDLLKVIHLNDSKNELGIKKDRHANIGEGNIGLETLRKVIRHPKIKNKIFILETPWKEDGPIYKQEIEILKKI